MTEKPVVPHELEKRDRDLIESIKKDDKHKSERVYKRLYRHYKAICQQYNDPVHYYGEMRPSEMAMLRSDLAEDIAAFETALTKYAPKRKLN